MRTPKVDRKKQSGQSIVEMLVTLFAFFTIAFMFVQVSMGFAVANYIQYATYMSARAFLSGHASRDKQIQAGRSVLEAMLTNNGVSRFRSVVEGSGEGLFPGAFVGPKTERVELGGRRARSTAWEQGATYKFKMRMYMLPMISAAPRGNDAKVELTSESWLGREPSEAECIDQLNARKARDLPTGASAYLFDNGC